jgi:hypothetical protein
MAQPFNYSLGLKSPMQVEQEAFTGEMQGLELQARIQQAQAQAIAEQQKAQQAALLQQQRQAAFARLNAPDVTPDDYRNAALLGNKDQVDVIMKMMAQGDETKNRAAIGKLSPIVFALHANKPERAISVLEQQKQAYEGNPEVQQELQSRIDAIKSDPEAAKLEITGIMSLIPGADKVLENLLKLTADRRAQEQAKVDIRKGTAEASLKEVQARFAPDQLAADLGLTRAQIGQANSAIRAQNAAAKASSATAARAQAEADQMASGIVPLEKRPELEGKLRKEYTDQTKVYQEVKSSYGRILAAEDSGAGDIGLIYGYMKMLDPASVVREGEFATAENTAGIDNKLRNMYNKVLTGQRLTPEQRKMFTGQAGKLYKSALEQESVVRNGIGRIAKGYGLNTSNIFYTESERPPTAYGGQPTLSPQGMPQGKTGVTVKLPNGQSFVFPNQQAADQFKARAGVR